MSFRYRYFGTFRLLLSLMVVFQHFSGNAAPSAFARRWQVYESGSLAVLVFFVLSGFVIAEAVDVVYRSKPAPFLINRVLRLAPHLVVANVFTIALAWVFERHGMFRPSSNNPLPATGAFSTRNIAGNLLGIVPYIGHFTTYIFIQFTWALRTETTFYLFVFVALILSVHLLRHKVGFDVVMSWLYLLMLPGVVLNLFGHGLKTFGFVSYFALGVGIYFATQRKRFAWFVIGTSLIIMFTRFFRASPVNSDGGFQRAVIPQACVLAGLLLVMVLLLRIKTDRWRAVDTYLGMITYPIYLYHYVVLILIMCLIPVPGYASFLGGMAFAVVFSALMARWLDPYINHLRDRVRGNRLSASSAPRNPSDTELVLDLAEASGPQ